MTTPFLQRVAQDLYKTYGGRFDRLTIVLPNKRTHLFLDEHIAALCDGPIWAPRYATISELFAELSPLTIADPIVAVCLLYPVFQKALSQEDAYDEDLDHFFSWGQVLLRDFEDVDNNMVNAQALFANMNDLDHLTSNGFLTDKQEEAIRQFFKTFSKNDRSQMQRRFRTLWSHLADIYETFQQTLARQGLAYEGMMKRRVVEQLQRTDETPARWQQRQFVIVGFNVLSESECRLFRLLKQRVSVRFYWDDDPADKDHEAIYRHVRENITRFGQDLPTPEEDAPRGGRLDTEHLSGHIDEPAITLVAAPSDSAQSRYAGQWLQRQTQGERSAIVLCDEHLLLPVLHALPPVEGLNITMGFPLQQTPVYAFLNVILNVQAGYAPKKSGDGTLTDRNLSQQGVVALLQHPYTTLLAPGLVGGWLRKIRTERLQYIPTGFFDGCPLLQQLLSPQKDISQLLEAIDKALHQLARHYGMATDSRAALHGEALFTAHRIINQLRAVQRCIDCPIPAGTLTRLLQQLARTATIPFHGEPITDVQVLGLLETRNLHFNHILILSANEGNLPKDTFTSSFIPYVLRAPYGLSTREQSCDLYAYYFRRLIQGGRSVDILYNSSTEGLNKGERSRFLTQMLASGRPLTLRSLHSPLKTGGLTLLPAEGLVKSNDVMQALRRRYDASQEGARFLSPSALNTYLVCPLQFGLHYAAGLKEPDKPLDDEVEANDFGSIFHQALQTLYSADSLGIGQRLQAEDVLRVAHDKDAIEEAVDRAFHSVYFRDARAEKGLPYTKRKYSGSQVLTREVLVRYVVRQLEADATLCPLTVEAVEDRSNEVTVAVPGQDFSVRLGGVIDRIDTITTPQGQLHRIVDYKTSTSMHTASNLDALFHPHNTSNHIFQTFYYADIYTTLHKDHPLAPALAYVKFASTVSDKPCVRLGKERVDDFAAQQKTSFHERLMETIGEIFDPARPFAIAAPEVIADTQNGACKYCPFTALCPRH